MCVCCFSAAWCVLIFVGHVETGNKSLVKEKRKRKRKRKRPASRSVWLLSLGQTPLVVVVCGWEWRCGSGCGVWWCVVVCGVVCVDLEAWCVVAWSAWCVVVFGSAVCVLGGLC